MESTIIESIYSNTCAIARCAPDFDWTSVSGRTDVWPGHGIPITVVGTGFLISPKVVITAAHIIRELRKLGIADSEIVAAFTVAAPYPNETVQIRFIKGNEILDVGATMHDGREISPKDAHPATDFSFLVMKSALTLPLVPNPLGLQ